MIPMADKDTITKDYMQDNATFADAFNFLIYGGEQVIDPQQLRPMDTTSIALPYGEDNNSVPVQRYRDILKMVTAMEDGNAAYLLLVLNIVTNSNLHYNEGEERVDMCEAIEGIGKDAGEEGILATLVSLVRKLESDSSVTSVTEKELKTRFAEIREKIRSGETDNIRALIEQFVHRVNVYPDRIEVIFNFYPDKVKYIPKTENEGRADARSSLFVPDIMVAESSKDNK